MVSLPLATSSPTPRRTAPSSSRTAWAVGVASAAAGFVAYRPALQLLADAFGIAADRRSCTMEEAAQCALQDTPRIVMTVLLVAAVVVALTISAAVTAVTLLLSARVSRRRRRSSGLARIAIGGFVAAWAVAGVVVIVGAVA